VAKSCRTVWRCHAEFVVISNSRQDLRQQQQQRVQLGVVAGGRHDDVDSRRYHRANQYRCAAVLGPDLQNVLRQSFDYLTIMPKLTIDLRRTSNLQNILRRAARLFLGTTHLQSCKIVSDSVRKLAYDIPKRNFSTI